MKKPVRKRSSRPSKKPKYGQCAWVWLGVKNIGTWVPDALGIMGYGCTNGGVCPNPNALGIKGDFAGQLLLIHCKKPTRDRGCEDNTCTYLWDGVKFKRDNSPDCNGNSPPCQCTDANDYRKPKLKGGVPIGTKCVTFCY
jgi:hypothetical protein